MPRDFFLPTMAKTIKKVVTRLARDMGHITGREIMVMVDLVIKNIVERMSIKVFIRLLEKKLARKMMAKMMLEKTLLGRFAG